MNSCRMGCVAPQVSEGHIRVGVDAPNPGVCSAGWAGWSAAGEVHRRDVFPARRENINTINTTHTSYYQSSPVSGANQVDQIKLRFGGVRVPLSKDRQGPGELHFYG